MEAMLPPMFGRRDLLAGALGSMVSASGSASGTGQQVSARRSRIVERAPSTHEQQAGVLLAYFRSIVPKLLIPATGGLRHPTVAISLPGAAYSHTLWDWDTRFTCQALFGICRTAGDEALRQRVLAHARGSLLSFLDHQSDTGRIPIMIDTSGAVARDAFPLSRNQAKPVMAAFALLVADEAGDVDWLASVFDKILAFHQSWKTKNMSKIGLLVWSDDVAAGPDNDPAVFGRPAYSCAHLYLNCLYYEDLRAAAVLAKRLKRYDDERRLEQRANDIATALRTHCWDPRDRFFYSVDVQSADQRSRLLPNNAPGMAMSWQGLPLRIQVVGGFMPLWCGVATPEQARAVIDVHYLGDTRFRAAAGVRSMSSLESMYSLQKSANPSNWLGPVWIISNYLVWRALNRYGHSASAKELANKTIHLLASDLAETGSLNEYYHPDSGVPISFPGFLNWNMLVIEMAYAAGDKP